MESVSYKLVRFAALEQGWESAVGFFVDMSVDLHRAFPHGVVGGLWRYRVQIVSLIESQGDYRDCRVQIVSLIES